MTFTRFFVIGSVCILAVEAANFHSVVKAPPTTQLLFVTNVEGKSFFADYTVHLDWIAAGDYCREMGMKLASITTNAQVNALKSAYRSEFQGVYWTSGRDAQTQRQFSWNETNIEVESLLSIGAIHTRPLTCIALYFYNTQTLPVGLYPCDNLLGTFCET